jgi:hypothetical protein
MAKKVEAPFTITQAELKKLSRNEQRRMLELGYVKGEAPAAAKA